MTHQPKAGKRIDPEMLAAYIDQRLSPEQRAAVEAQLATDPDAYAVFVDTVRALEALEEDRPADVVAMPAPPKPRISRSAIASVLAIAAALAVVVWTQPQILNRLRGGAPVDPLMAQLVDAVGEERYIEARLTGGFKYGPLRSVTRGAADSQQNLGLLAAAGALQREAKENPTPAHLHAWGVAQLLVGDLDRAIETLENAATAAQADPALLSDLSAAYLTRARHQDRPDDFPKALVFADRALARNDSMAEALHNRALALEALSLRELAAEAWRRLEQQGGEWSAEAAERRRVLESKPSAESVWPKRLEQMTRTGTVDIDGVEWEARQWLRREAMPQLIDARLAGSAVEGTLELVPAIAKALAPFDRFDEDWLHHIERLTPDAAKVERQLAERFSTVLPEAGSGAIAAHGAVIRSSARAAAEIGSPLVSWFDYFAIEAERASGGFAAAAEHAGVMANQVSSLDYTTLTARLHWVQGVAELQVNRSQLAAESLAKSIRHFSRARDSVGRGRVLSQLSSLQQLVGLDVQGWRSAIEALAIAADHADPMLKTAIGTVTAAVALDRDCPEVAVAMLESQAMPLFRAVTAAEQTQRDLRLAEALSRLGRSTRAREVLERARRSADAIDLPSVRRNARALEAQISARLSYQAGDREGAGAEATKALREAIGNPFQQVTWKVIAAAAANGVDESRAALEAALDTTDELYRGRVTLGLPLVDRMAMLDAAERVIRGLVEDGDVNLASAVADRTTSAVGLWRSPSGALGASRSDQSPSGRVVLQYFPGRDGTYAWIHDADGIKAYRVASTREELLVMVTGVREAAERGDVATFDRLCSAAYQLLIAPLGDSLKRGRTLVVVASGPLQGLPFAALRPSVAAERLGALLPVAMAPSVGSAKSADWVTPTGSVLLVGNDASDLQGWRPLVGPQRELEKVAAASPTATLLVGPAGTPDALSAALQQAPSVFYFAGHSSLDFTRPERSGLVFSSSGAPWTFSIEEFSHLALPLPTTVILSTCSSARQLGRDVEASVSLVSGLGALGAKQSLAALWDLSDRVAPEVFSEITISILQGKDGLAAVQEAQRKASKASDEVLLGALGVVVFLSS